MLGVRSIQPVYAVRDGQRSTCTLENEIGFTPQLQDISFIIRVFFLSKNAHQAAKGRNILDALF